MIQISNVFIRKLANKSYKVVILILVYSFVKE